MNIDEMIFIRDTLRTINRHVELDYNGYYPECFLENIESALDLMELELSKDRNLCYEDPKYTHMSDMCDTLYEEQREREAA